MKRRLSRPDRESTGLGIITGTCLYYILAHVRFEVLVAPAAVWLSPSPYRPACLSRWVVMTGSVESFESTMMTLGSGSDQKFGALVEGVQRKWVWLRGFFPFGPYTIYRNKDGRTIPAFEGGKPSGFCVLSHVRRRQSLPCRYEWEM